MFAGICDQLLGHPEKQLTLGNCKHIVHLLIRFNDALYVICSASEPRQLLKRPRQAVLIQPHR